MGRSRVGWGRDIGGGGGLESYLRAQHMKTRRVHAEVGTSVIYGEAVAYATSVHDCSTVYFIQWRADASGKRTELDAKASDSGCL